jgi:hypothetical protein
MVTPLLGEHWIGWTSLNANWVTCSSVIQLLQLCTCFFMISNDHLEFDRKHEVPIVVNMGLVWLHLFQVLAIVIASLKKYQLKSTNQWHPRHTVGVQSSLDLWCHFIVLYRYLCKYKKWFLFELLQYLLFCDLIHNFPYYIISFVLFSLLN